MPMNGLAQRLGRLEQRATELGLGSSCNHPLHGCPEIVMLLAAGDSAPPVLCPGCGEARPLAVVRLVRVSRDANGELTTDD